MTKHPELHEVQRMWPQHEPMQGIVHEGREP